jgi:hypothetical protein
MYIFEWNNTEPCNMQIFTPNELRQHEIEGDKVSKQLLAPSQDVNPLLKQPLCVAEVLCV